MTDGPHLDHPTVEAPPKPLPAPSAKRPRRSPLWLPYLTSIKETRKGVFEFVFNGGEETVNVDEILSIMIYGEADTQLDTRILSKLCGRGIPIVVHRRNVPRAPSTSRQKGPIGFHIPSLRSNRGSMSTPMCR